MKKNLFLLSALCLISFLTVSCSNDDNEITNFSIVLDKEEYGVPFNEDFFTAKVTIQPDDIDVQGYVIKIGLLKYSSSSTDGKVHFPKISQIIATKAPNEYLITIDRDGVEGTFAFNVSSKAGELLAQKSFEVSNIDNEYSYYPNYTIKLSEQRETANIALTGIYDHYPELQLSQISLCTPEGTTTNNGIITEISIEDQTLKASINPNAEKTDRGIWYCLIKGASKEHSEVIVRVYFNVED